jgi:cytochrome c2
MKKIISIVLILIGLLMLIILSAMGYVKYFLPNVGSPPELSVEITDSHLERGNYLANHVMVCIDCHSLRDWQSFSGPPIAGTEGAGGEIFGREFGFPGVFISPNITPYGLKDWTDGEIFRTITTGVNKSGKAIFPVMPYLSYGKMDKSDIISVIAYIRTLPELASTIPEREIDFPVSLIINTIPKKASLTTIPNPENNVDYGRYVTLASACADCHTKEVEGKVVGEYLAGGFEFRFPDGSVLRSSNITPHVTGIGLWDRDFFINRFKDYTADDYELPVVQPGEFQTVMPWFMYSGMTVEDLGAIFDYLKTATPVENVVERFSVAAK